MVSNTRLKKEIEAVKTTIENLEKIGQHSLDGIGLNKLVLEKFEDALKSNR